MLSINDLKTITSIPNEADISLRLYAEFYNTHMANRSYEIKLKNHTPSTIQLDVTPANFPHLIGLGKFQIPRAAQGNSLLKDPAQLEKFQGYFNLYKGRITLNDLKAVPNRLGGSLFDVWKDRILGLPFSYQLLRNSTFVSFDPSKTFNKSAIKGDFLFYNDISQDRLHLVIGLNRGIHYPVTFLTTNHNNSVQPFDNFTKDQTPVIQIESIVVRDIKTRQILETIIPGGQALPEVAATQAEKNPEATKTEITVKEQIVELYKKEFQGITHISESTAQHIHHMIEKKGYALSLNEIKQEYLDAGKKLEQDDIAEDLMELTEEFEVLKDIVDDLKQAQLLEAQSKAQVKAQAITKSNSFEIGD